MSNQDDISQIEKSLSQLPDKIVLFDGVCNLCNTAVQFIIKHDSKGIIKLASLQSEVGQQLAKYYNIEREHLNTMAFIDNNKAYIKSSAALRISKYLNGWPKIFSFFTFIPFNLRDSIYDIIATNRYKWFGKSDSCMLPTEDIAARFL